MSPAKAHGLIVLARHAGLALGVSQSGRLSYAGPASVFERFKPAVIENREAILKILRSENEKERARLDWWKAPVEGWPHSLTIRNISTGRQTTIKLSYTHD